ncbi:NUDIX domain-containing protein [Solihabitans fulvus]|uniref:NUDIX domain-containing protein n=1 Tax=Solihabitans fulvus TaxID=1892852 RepID=A0A5B2XL72_9PSEU|nr:NUDIX domain-containing protein [Solihabitans fulvus]KAA2264066.1 NUDIX domain-containing protein [Solihabitans fulvus]
MIDKVAWIHVVDGRILSTRSHGKDAYYLPGGKREPGESDVETLVREVSEELTVDIDPASSALFGVFAAQAHGREAGVLVQMTCYTAEYRGSLAPSNEIAELAWLSYADRDRVSPVDQIIFDHLRDTGQLA